MIRDYTQKGIGSSSQVTGGNLICPQTKTNPRQKAPDQRASATVFFKLTKQQIVRSFSRNTLEGAVVPNVPSLCTPFALCSFCLVCWHHCFGSFFCSKLHFHHNQWGCSCLGSFRRLWSTWGSHFHWTLPWFRRKWDPWACLCALRFAWLHSHLSKWTAVTQQPPQSSELKLVPGLKFTNLVPWRKPRTNPGPSSSAVR